MRAPDLDRLTASGAARALRERRCSSEGLVRACLARIDEHNPRINALVATDPAAALAAARDADARIAAGDAFLPLLGVPMSIKDAFATKDLPTTASFRELHGYRHYCDATIVARLRAAGAILMGKSNLPELAGAPHCWSPLFGPTRNPWNPALTPGGSSGGAAAAIAAGFSLIEAGSDIGGSIRIPAAYCGVASLRATENRIPRTGHIPHLPPHLPGPGRSVWHMLSMGLLARSVEDLHLAYGLVAGPDGVDSTVPPLSVPAPLPSPALAASPLRIALWDEFAGLPLDAHTREGLGLAVRKLEAAGHELVRCAPPEFDVEAAWDAFGAIGGVEIGLGLPAWQRRMLALLRGLLPRDHRIMSAVARGMALDLHAYNRALNRREALIGALERFLARWDAVLCPVAATAPYPGTPMSPLAKPPRLPVGDVRLPYFEATVALTIPFSVTGSPVVTLPVGLVAGLPAGVQVIGRRWGEEALLATCARLEAAFGGFRAPPLERPDDPAQRPAGCDAFSASRPAR